MVLGGLGPQRGLRWHGRLSLEFLAPALFIAHRPFLFSFPPNSPHRLFHCFGASPTPAHHHVVAEGVFLGVS